jgi:UDPglucose--hexose-1-phosphate uridylyltransferase
MPELRRDPFIGRWVIIATERSKRPNAFSVHREQQGSTPCPFCPGNEDKTPPEVLAYGPPKRPANGGGWWVRVIPNKFPALHIEGDLHRTGEDLFDRMDGTGAHEVVIETDDHTKSLEELPEERVRDVLWSWRDRVLDLRKDERFEYIMIFKNAGAAAGASIQHTHSQLIALPMVPIRVKQKMRGSEEYFEKRGRSIFSDIIKAEKAKGVRVVEENDHFIALAPFAARFPFETWIIPKSMASHYEEIGEKEALALARTMKSVLTRMNKVLDNPAYNFLIHTAPLRWAALGHFTWHIEIIPKLVQTAGFEWGTGFYINPVSPEDAAKYLREENP